jgi:hypothetical protein
MVNPSFDRRSEEKERDSKFTFLFNTLAFRLVLFTQKNAKKNFLVLSS